MPEPDAAQDPTFSKNLTPITGKPSQPSQFKGPSIVDVELTNACNTACTFCPRDKTPRRGFMAETTFDKMVERIGELDEPPQVKLCGLGEPLLHPRAVDFVRRLADNGVMAALTTNGQLLSKEMAKRLIDAGLSRLSVSASGTGQLYEEIHKLHFETIKRNVENFLEIAGSQPGSNDCQLIIQIVATDEVARRIEDIKSFWQAVGVGRINVFDMANRGGAVDIGQLYRQSERFRSRAESLLVEHNIDPLCGVPFVIVFIGWDGNYYMCCHDYEKRHPLGNVFDYGILEINGAKKGCLLEDFSVCKKCDVDKANVVRQTLAKIEQGISPRSELDRRLKRLAADSKRLSATSINFGEDKRRISAKLLWKEEKRNCA